MRLADLIAEGLDKDKIETIVRLIEDENMPTHEKLRSLVLSGAAAGAEETLKRAELNSKKRDGFLGNLMKQVDEALDQSTTQETTEALAKVRNTVAGALQEVRQDRLERMAAQVSSDFGIQQDMLEANNDPADYARIDLIAIGSEAFRKIPDAVYGWHHGRTKGLPQGMTCVCINCYRNLFSSLPTQSQEMSLRQMVTDFEGMDNAMAEYAVYLIGYLRSRLNEVEGVENHLEAVDPQASASLLQDLLSGLRKS